MIDEYLKYVDFSTGENMKKFIEEIFKNEEYLFIRNEIEQEYITSIPIKVKYGYCSHCKNEFKINNNIGHNDDVVCPSCKANLRAKEVRYGKKKLTNEVCLYWFEKSLVDPTVVICKGYYVSKDYEKDYKNPSYNYNLRALYIFDTLNNKSKMFTKNYNWEERASIFDFNQGWLALKWCHCSFKSLDRAVKNTIFQYSNYKKYCGKESIVKYLGRFNQYKWVEQLVKIGFSEIADAVIWKDNIYNCINYKGKDIFKKLRLNRREVKNIRESNIAVNPKILRFYQLEKKHNFNPNIEKIKEFDDKYGWDYASAVTILKYLKIGKVLKYMDVQFKKYNNECYSHEGEVFSMLKDYIESCEKLCRDCSNENVLLPKDLYKAHQDIMKLIKVEGDKRLDKKIEKRLENLKKIYLFKDETYFIRPAESSRDLIKEGDTLNHCVAKNYSIPYANGKTDILFLRKISEPDKPLVTIEVKNGKIKQAYGKNDKSPKENIQMFIDKFRDTVLQKKGKVA